MMRYLVLTGDETADDLKDSIRNLRARQQRAGIQSTRDELAEDIDELLGMLAETSR